MAIPFMCRTFSARGAFLPSPRKPRKNRNPYHRKNAACQGKKKSRLGSSIAPIREPSRPPATRIRELQTTQAFLPFPDLGDYYDNAAALSVGLHDLANGQPSFGLEIVQALYQHIMRTQEVKSLTWLMPEIRKILDGH